MPPLRLCPHRSPAAGWRDVRRGVSGVEVSHHTATEHLLCASTLSPSISPLSGSQSPGWANQYRTVMGAMMRTAQGVSEEEGRPSWDTQGQQGACAKDFPVLQWLPPPLSMQGVGFDSWLGRRPVCKAQRVQSTQVNSAGRGRWGGVSSSGRPQPTPAVLSPASSTRIYNTSSREGGRAQPSALVFTQLSAPYKVPSSTLGIFPTQGLELRSPTLWAESYHLSHLGSL